MTPMTLAYPDHSPIPAPRILEPIEDRMQAWPAVLARTTPQPWMSTVHARA